MTDSNPRDDKDGGILWSEPRQLWDGRWYRVGSSTGANLDTPLSSCPPVDRNAVLEEAAKLADVFFFGTVAEYHDAAGGKPMKLPHAIRALKSAVPEFTAHTQDGGSISFKDHGGEPYTGSASERHETVACGRDCKGPGSDGCVFPRCTRYAREQNTYNTAADAVQEVAEEVAQAFRDVGLEPGEWYGDNIVVDVKRWIASDIVRLAARSSSTPAEVRVDVSNPCDRAVAFTINGQQYLVGGGCSSTLHAPASAITPTDSSGR